MNTKRAIWLTAVLGLLGVLLTGCGWGQETAVPTPTGPALILFYTEA